MKLLSCCCLIIVAFYMGWLTPWSWHWSIPKDWRQTQWAGLWPTFVQEEDGCARRRQKLANITWFDPTECDYDLAIEFSYRLAGLEFMRTPGENASDVLLLLWPHYYSGAGWPGDDALRDFLLILEDFNSDWPTKEH